jgi:hypothetical protein
LVIAVALGIYVRLLAGGPFGPLPGGALRGEPAVRSDDSPVVDWSFARNASIAVESGARWLPYSSSPWFMVYEGRFYLLLTGLLNSGLIERLAEEPALRLRVDGRIHEVVATRITRPEETAHLARPAMRRLMAIETVGAISRIDSRGEETIIPFELRDRSAGH